MNTPYDRLKGALIAEWKGSWKLWSVQLNAVGLAIMAVAEFARDGIDYIPPGLMGFLPNAKIIAMVFFALGIASRLLRQKPKA